MTVIPNSWVEKAKKKVVDAPSNHALFKNDFATQTKKPEKRHTPSLNATMNKTLRGVRK